LVNVVGTYNVLDAALAGKVGKVVFASSGTALGFTFQVNNMVPRYFPIDEEHPCEPQDEYGLSKLLGEVVSKSYSDAHGLKTICLRINANWDLDREGAAMAGRAGAFKSAPMTVEQIWESYRFQLDHPDGPFPVPGPPPPRNNMWMYTDARDGAQAFRLALENEDLRHEVFLICADDTWSTTETPELVQYYYPEVPVRQSLKGYASLVSHTRATRMLGYIPQYTWRKSEFAEWMAASR
jgi:nucleoside-diphosphate-sugar epimerase